MDTVLLIGANEAVCWSVAKCFAEYGFAVHLVDWEDHPVKLSKYISHFEIIYSPSLSARKSSQELISYLGRKTYKFILPVNDAAVELLRFCENEILQNHKVLGWNGQEAYQYAHDKYEVIKACEQLGIKAPRTYLVRSLKEFKPDNFEFPLIVKPASSCLIWND